MDDRVRRAAGRGEADGITGHVPRAAPRRRTDGESVEQIQRDPIAPTGRRTSRSPSGAGIHRAIAEHARRKAHPGAAKAARFAP
ncbi:MULTISPECIES: hypothetical protein [unclassified Streptomyces]|uniref:hypothetical protein n=1 Tax=unclassified Streptomyces TaxID=2593676 RepID=UPI0033ADAE8B